MKQLLLEPLQPKQSEMIKLMNEDIAKIHQKKYWIKTVLRQNNNNKKKK